MEKENYIIYNGDSSTELVMSLTRDQANAISTFMEEVDYNGCIELATEYCGVEVTERMWK